VKEGPGAKLGKQFKQHGMWHLAVENDHALDTALYLLVIRPLQTVSATADKVSKGEIDLPAVEVRGRDEISDVTASFNRMHVSLAKALRMLDQ